MDFTNVKQSLMLLKAGTDPMTANMLLRKYEDDTNWFLIVDTDHQVTFSQKDEKGDIQKVSMKDFPRDDFNIQKLFAATNHFMPAWSLEALLNVIPDDRRQTVMITRGGYDSSEIANADEDGYISDVYFANYDYNDEENNVFFSKIYGGDTYIEAVTDLVVDYLTNIRKLISRGYI